MTRARVWIATLLVCAGATSDASAATIFLGVPPSVVEQPPLEGPFQLDFAFGNELDGVALTGQSISLDLLFANGILARILAADGGLSFGVGLALQTNAGTFPGFAGSGSTGFLLAPDGSALHDPRSLGSAASSSGELFVGLFPPLQSFDMAGVHYDITLPNTGYAITSGSVQLTNHSPWTRADFGTIAQLADDGPPMWLSALVLGSLLGFGGARVRAATTGRTAAE